MTLLARERQDLLDDMLAIPRLDNEDFETVEKWLPVIDSDDESYTLDDNGTRKVFMSIDLEFKEQMTMTDEQVFKEIEILRGKLTTQYFWLDKKLETLEHRLLNQA